VARHPRSRIGRVPSPLQRAAVPIVMTMVASMITLLPMISTAPILPPFGLVVLLAWRTIHRTIWPAWIGLPLGLWDDLFSGQVIGSAMMMWTISLFFLDIADRRMVWRDVWQEWGLTAMLCTAVLLCQLWAAHATGGGTNALLLLPQMLITIFAFPPVARLCAAVDEWRLR
jgi:rod shape-determining protein MreD